MTTRNRLQQLLVGLLCLGQLLPANAALTEIANYPLGIDVTPPVKPNLLFILDDSGSMGQDYTPDYVVSNYHCNAHYDIDSWRTGCRLGEVPYMASGFNSQYYNPELRYAPPKKADGTSFPNANAEAVNTSSDRFATGGTINLLKNYPEVEYCSEPDPTDSNKCRRNLTGYTYPNSTYFYARLINYTNGDYYSRTAENSPYYFLTTTPPIWCSDTAKTICQASRTAVFRYPSYQSLSQSGVKPTAVVTIERLDTMDVGSIKVGAIEIFSGAAATESGSNAASRNAFAQLLVTRINASGTGFTAAQTTTASGTGSARITITGPNFSADINNVTPAINNGAGADSNIDSSKFSGGVAEVSTTGAVFQRVDIVPATTSYTKYTKRTDCAGSSCTYAEELQNFANWYQYYRTRMLSMKSSASAAFYNLSDQFRVGFSVISKGSGDESATNTVDDLAISDFDTTHKATWFARLLSARAHSYTPLRGALSRAGQLYAGKWGTDPIQYSCQQNFTLLTTDGYWNTNAELPTFGPYDASGAEVGDADSGKGAPFQDTFAGTGYSNTLADVAMHYYTNDLRGEATMPGRQNMVTFTLGLGVDGILKYSDAYQSGGSIDYNKILNGTLSWPNPIANAAEQRIDDLWHAAVNGRGTYFSAKDPDTVATSLSKALSQLEAKVGAASAAATSNLEPVAGDNFAYVASYETKTWVGNVQALEIDLIRGTLAETPTWETQPLLDAKAVAGTRTIYKFDSGATNNREPFTWANLTAAEQAYFNPTQLSQCTTGCTGVNSEYLYNFLIKGAGDTSTKLRARDHVLGDVVNTQPVFVGAPKFSYADAGYSSFKTTHETRSPVLYVAANDGMLHAFDATKDSTGGNELWAYVPTEVLPNLHKLADTNYENNHRYYVDGHLTVGDVYDGSAWRTILVGGLGAGGRSFFALDVTSPTNPKMLWEFTDTHMGLAFGNPLITKLADGKWVVLVSSGYNNVTGSGDGQGRLYAINAVTGVKEFDISTGVGSTTTPSGLGKINGWVEDAVRDNTTKWVYGGDNLGNVWRFDINNTIDPAGREAFKVVETGQPITTKVELGESAGGLRMVLFGTGRLLGLSDRSNTDQQTIYSVSDKGNGTFGLAHETLTTPRAAGSPLVQQTLTNQVVATGVDAGKTIRVASSNAVDLDTKRGCYVDLPEPGERINIDPKLQLGVFVLASNKPESSACTSGGESWLYQIDYQNCQQAGLLQDGITTYAATKIANALAVGINIVRLPGMKTVVLTRTSDNQNQTMGLGNSGSLPTERRVSWRELIRD
ncbi:pilus assembly protein [Chitinimonas sp. BJYL2]|uniref:pilus assembly protein n=1 Tax=Chitinimonas sp. BJYL2 TaxID=2976696 RepID=UPI0022B37705|nr:PilC/PilY family type IV pilus protein [Chitinimonas sp. BJYL2]